MSKARRKNQKRSTEEVQNRGTEKAADLIAKAVRSTRDTGEALTEACDARAKALGALLSGRSLKLP